LLYLAQDIFHQRVTVPRWLKPAIAGLIVGLVGIFLPQVLGVGYETIDYILNGEIVSFWLLVSILIAKLVLTPVSIGGGFLGGVFAPSLFIGSALGAAYAVGLNLFLPGLSIIPGAFAMVGMAAVLAGSVHAPLTAVILLFEMTNDYRIILPVMFAVVVSMVISQRFVKDSIYTLGLARKGIRLERGKVVDVLETLTVANVMQPPPMVLSESDSIDEVSRVFAETRHHGLPVLNERGELTGIITTQDLSRAQEGNSSKLRVAEICTHEIIHVYPDESIGQALRRMGGRDIGRLPVVSRSDPRQMVGWLRRSDLLRAYDVALTERASRRHRIQQVRLGVVNEERVKISEYVIESGSYCEGKKVKEVDWPTDCLIASLRRGRHVIIPHGDTHLEVGDTLVILTENEADTLVARLFTTQSG
jgi:CIC family chloride channel protein